MRRRQFTSFLMLPLLALSKAKARAAEKTIVLVVEGMTWDGCARSVEKALKETKGVIDAKVSYPKAEAWIKYDDEKITVAKLREVINRTGFKAGDEKK
jgi:copper chaperone CopZ